VQRLDATRKKLIKKAAGAHEVTYDMVIRSARVSVHRTTAARSLGPQICWRRLREKPPRTDGHGETRMDVCDVWRKKPAAFWRDRVDLIIDNKKFPIPTTEAAKRRLLNQKLRGVLRTRSEGLAAGFTKSNMRKHKFNAGGYVSILAGICGDRIVLWEEVRGRWTGKAAAAMYEGPIKRALAKHRPRKRTWLIMEDNDPTGFKSNAAKHAKAENGMRTLNQPAYSPDLNPLDFSIWEQISKKALAKAQPQRETVKDYKANLRRTALRMPRKTIRKAVAAIRGRAEAIFLARGGNIARD